MVRLFIMQSTITIVEGGADMRKVEISEHRLNELSQAQSDLMKLQKKMNELDKPTQELLSKLERYRSALSTIAFCFDGGVSVESMRMVAIARKAL